MADELASRLPVYMEDKRGAKTESAGVVVESGLKKPSGEHTDDFLANVEADIDAVISEARAKLPLGTVFEVRGRGPTDYKQGVMSFYRDELKNYPLVDRIPYDKAPVADGGKGYFQSGYLFMGRFIA